MGIARGKTIEVKGSGEGTYTVLKVLDILQFGNCQIFDTDWCVQCRHSY